LKKLVRVLLFFSFLISCDSNSENQQWQKGNLHTHSFWSDGNDFPEMIIQWYKNQGYQFIALSDHNTIAKQERWYELSKRDIENKVLEKYENAYGDWVETQTDSTGVRVRLKTFDEYRSKLEEPGRFLIIKSEEVTSSYEKKPIHINVTNIQEKIEPVKGSSVVEIMQKTLDLVHAQREKLGIPMFAHINHPNFGYGISTEDLKKLNGERFFELYNGHPAVNNAGNDEYDSTEIMWDLVNIHYLDQGKPLLYGIATDDSHHYHNFTADLSNTGRGWVMVNSKKLETSSLIEAMEKGDFYASTGITIKKYVVTKNQIRVEVEPEQGVHYEILFLGYKDGGEAVETLERIEDTKGSYTFQDNDLFVRVKITSDALKESPPNTQETKQAWTQPFLVKN
jgi:hypothetical protein